MTDEPKSLEEVVSLDKDDEEDWDDFNFTVIEGYNSLKNIYSKTSNQLYSGICVGGPKAGEFHMANSQRFRCPCFEKSSFNSFSGLTSSTMETVQYVWQELPDSKKGFWRLENDSIANAVIKLLVCYGQLTSDEIHHMNARYADAQQNLQNDSISDSIRRSDFLRGTKSFESDDPDS